MDPEDNNGNDGEKDTTKYEKGCFLDFVFEMRKIIENDKKEILF